MSFSDIIELLMFLVAFAALIKEWDRDNKK